MNPEINIWALCLEHNLYIRKKKVNETKSSYYHNEKVWNTIIWNAGVKIPDCFDINAKAELKLRNVFLSKWFLGKVTLKEQSMVLGWKKKPQKNPVPQICSTDCHCLAQQIIFYHKNILSSQLK